MNLDKIGYGNNAPKELNVVVEIPANSPPIKYEVSKEASALVVDRFIGTPMFYPANYGFVPNTLCDDGDPLDVLVVTPYPLLPGCIIQARPIGMLNMEDESGKDAKVIALPIEKLTPMYNDIRNIDHLNNVIKEQIVHFFENYKDLEPGKWVKVHGWDGIENAHEVIVSSLLK